VTAYATPEQVRHVVQAAGLAPSVHNTQPWRFVAGPERLELHAEDDRQLAVLDPDGRQLHLSCGAALLHARVSARALGLDVAVRLLPDPTRPHLLAEVVLTEGEPAAADDVQLALAMLRRHTHRGPFDDRRVPEAFVEQLRAAAEAEGALLEAVVGEDQLVELEVLLAAADAHELRDPEYRAEALRWVQAGRTHPDGLPMEVATTFAGSSLRQRDFTLTRQEDAGAAPVAEHPTVVVLATEDDSALAWLKAGQALAAVLLRAAEQGVQAQPLGQVTDVVAYRLGLRAALGMVGLPQLVLRMGFAASTPVTPRRTVEDVLSVVAQ
jgi:hypothetical protein